MPTERAEDGLALSSRNGYLSPSERQLAPVIYKTLTALADAIHQQGIDDEIALASARHELEEHGFRIDYLELRRRSDLQPARADDHELVVLVAAFLGRTRLIDNLQFTRHA